MSGAGTLRFFFKQDELFNIVERLHAGRARKEAGAFEQSLRLMIKIGNAHAYVPLAELPTHVVQHLGSGAVDHRHRAGIDDEPAGIGRQGVGDRGQLLLDLIGVIEKQTALDERDGHAGHRPGFAPSVKLVNSVSPWNSSQHDDTCPHAFMTI